MRFGPVAAHWLTPARRRRTAVLAAVAALPGAVAVASAGEGPRGSA